jgi:probable addiction module antidote protein
MNTVFIGGSRHVSRLSHQVQERLANVMQSGARVIVGDANGADKAVQRFLANQAYPNVTVFCSGDTCRNNLGQWDKRNIHTPKDAKGFDFFAAKDRAMAREADFGLMIWDGKSVGTILNVLRLVRAGRKAVLINARDKTTATFKTSVDWDQFVSHFTQAFRSDLRKRATPEEWNSSGPQQQTSFLDTSEFSDPIAHRLEYNKSEDEIATEINAALATGDSASVVDALGHLAKTRGMSQVAKDTGLARESLYRSLSLGGNPEFTTILKVLSSMGLRLMVHKSAENAGDKQT